MRKQNLSEPEKRLREKGKISQMQQEGKDKAKRATLQGPLSMGKTMTCLRAARVPEVFSLGASLHHVLQNGLNGSLFFATKNS